MLMCTHVICMDCFETCRSESNSPCPQGCQPDSNDFNKLPIAYTGFDDVTANTIIHGLESKLDPILDGERLTLHDFLYSLNEHLLKFEDEKGKLERLYDDTLAVCCDVAARLDMLSKMVCSIKKQNVCFRVFLPFLAFFSSIVLRTKHFTFLF